MSKKICPKCSAEHEKPGKFCSRQCANSRQFSPESRALLAKKQSEYLKTEKGKQQKIQMEEIVSDVKFRQSEQKYRDEFDEPLGIVDFDDEYDSHWTRVDDGEFNGF